MPESGGIEDETQSALDARKMTSGKLACLIPDTALWQCLLTHEVGDIGYVDTHRARGGAQTVARTGLVALIAVLLDKGG